MVKPKLCKLLCVFFQVSKVDLHRELVILIAQDSVADFPVSSKVVAIAKQAKDATAQRYLRQIYESAKRPKNSWYWLSLVTNIWVLEVFPCCEDRTLPC